MHNALHNQTEKHYENNFAVLTEITQNSFQNLIIPLNLPARQYVSNVYMKQVR